MRSQRPCKQLIKRCFVLLLLTWLTACEQSSTPEPSGKVFKLVYANFVENGKEIEQDDVLEGILAANAAHPYLENGDRLEIIHKTQGEPLAGVSKILQDYKEQDRVSAILLGSNSKVVLDIKDDINALNIPTLAVIATHPDITSGVDFINQLSFDDVRQGQAAALFVRDELFINRVAVVFDDADPYSGNLAQIFRTKFEQTGGFVDGFYLASQIDQLTLKQLKDKDTPFIYMPLGAHQVLDLITQLNAIDWDPALMGADGLLANLLQKYPGRSNELEGMYVTELYTHTDELVGMAKYVKRVASLFNKTSTREASTETALGVEGYRVIRDAMNRCPDKMNRACINREIRSGEIQQGIISTFSIRANGKANRPIYINTIENDKLHMIVKVH